MKKISKINKNAFVFLLALILIASGVISKPLIKSVGSQALHTIKGDISVSEAIENIETSASENLRYHDALMNLNSYVLRLTGTRSVAKDDEYVVRMDNDYLAYDFPYVNDEYIAQVTENISELYNCAADNGSEFLYVMCPTKGYQNAYPDGVDNYAKINWDRFADSLNDKGIPNLNLRKCMAEDGITDEEMFFVTDHHWKPNSGFWAYSRICDSLNQKYGFEYNEDYTDISNFNIKTYENWFLGSHGKKVGAYFSPLGIDDIDMITPKFETSLVEEQPMKNEVRAGSFEKSVIYMKNIQNKDLFGKNPYAAYSGGDFRMQIITNELNSDGKTFLIIRDSYACTVTPFLSLQAKQLYIADMRDYESYVGDKINAFDYIREINPDYVLVVYNGITTEEDADGRYDFG